ncbi:phage tail tape measure protein [Deefgea piscis]|uniref:phage tail tape measure protein n=1 Tax=Deefgea piscis TaxID=2739061 RepID=UPI001C7EEFFF|nr:phage tail tape measure protein [Deefgea piscis]QZA80233.1 phage tail tape measure protein [Deefgea piscis]
MDMLQLGIQLKAFDHMSSVISGAANKSIGSLDRLEKKFDAVSQKLSGKGMSMMADGAILTGLMTKPIAAFADAEDAATGLKVAMMGAGGVVDKKFDEINAKALKLGTTLPGTTADFQNMMSTLVKQGMSYDAILGGVGESAAYMGVLLKKSPEQAAEFAAKMQDATGTTEKDMMSLMDTIQRSVNLGVKDDNMLAFYAKMAPAMDTMKRKGADAAKEMAPFAVMFDQMGMQGEAAGNALRKTIQLGLDTKKVAKANAALASQGIKLDFTDGKGEFGGMGNLMAQLDKMKNLDTVTRLAALKEIFGDDAETMQVLGKVIEKGAGGYNEVVDKLSRQATLQQRVNAQLGTLKNLWDAASGTFTNALASFGEAMAPELKSAAELFGTLSQKLDTFIKQNPMLAKSIGIGTLALGGLLLAGGAVAMTLGLITKMAGGVMKPIAALGGLFGKKKGAGVADAASALAGAAVQRVFVVNMPGGGVGVPDLGRNAGAVGTAGPAGAAKPSRWGKMAGGVSKWAGRAGAAAAVAGLAYGAYELSTDKKMSAAQKVEKAGGIVGGAGGAWGGAVLGAKGGAMIGTLIAPGVGTAIGGALGGLIGGFVGSSLGQKLGEMSAKTFNQAEKPRALSAAAPSYAAATAAPVVQSVIPAYAAASSVKANADPVMVAKAAPALAPAQNVAQNPKPLPHAPVSLPAKAAPVAPTYAAAANIAPKSPPLNPVANGSGSKPSQIMQMTYSPQLTIQGDPLPGTKEKFAKMLREHQTEIQTMIARAMQQQQRVSYAGGA